MRALVETASLFVDAAQTHVQHLAPAAENMTPPLYAGKTETVCAVMALDVLGTSVTRARDPATFGQFLAGLNLVIRANDEVIDGTMPYTDEVVTTKALNNTPIFQRFAGPNGRYVTGAEGMLVAMEAVEKLIPGTGEGSIKRRNEIESLLGACTKAAADTANNPDYQKGVMLPFDTTLRIKDETNGLLGRTCIATFAPLLDVPEKPNDRLLFERIAVAVQFGDDFLDWRKDWAAHRDASQKSSRPVRPQQNLFNSTLLEFGNELQACEAVLDDPTKRSTKWARQLAPQTYKAFRARFKEVVDQYPEKHPYAGTAKRICNFMLNTLVQYIPEKGRFHNWGKY